jgi:hypothetical protein
MSSYLCPSPPLTPAGTKGATSKLYPQHRRKKESERTKIVSSTGIAKVEGYV